MGFLIDSSVLIAWERDRLDLQSQLAEYAEEDFAISANSASELLHGVHRAANPAQRRRREAFVEGLLARLPIISFDAVAARPCSAFGRACSRWNGNQFAQSHHCRHCVGKGLYRHHSRRTQLSQNSGVVVSTLVIREARVPLDSKIKDLTLTLT
jgi:uncharacterized protein with PIN domain